MAPEEALIAQVLHVPARARIALAGQDERALERVLELADVAWPGVSEETFARTRFELPRRGPPCGEETFRDEGSSAGPSQEPRDWVKPIWSSQ